MKNFLLVLTLLFSLAACESKPDALETLRQRQDQNVQVVQEMFAHFNKHDWEAMAALYAEKAEFKDPAYGTEPKMQTRADIVAHYSELAQMIPDVQDDVKNLYPAGERQVVVEFVSKGTGPDGQAFALPICTILTINDGKITADYTYYDQGCQQ
jgi:steroid delta-isomerase-like uncharacterized protein